MVRKYFGTDGIRARANVFPMTADFALRCGRAIGIYLKKHDSTSTVIIGRDTRLSGIMLENAIVAGLTSVGISVLKAGIIPTPAISILVREMQCGLGLMISASHNPYYDNGIKLFDKYGRKFPNEIEEQLEGLIDSDLSDQLVLNDQIGTVYTMDEIDYASKYFQYIKEHVKNITNLTGLKVVLDCANGAASKIAPLILRDCGVEVIEMCCSPNGKNINDNCGATHTDFLQEAVIKNKSDLGLALDGDADRIILVDEKGDIVDGDKIIGLIATQLWQENKLNKQSVVVTQMSNLGLEIYLKNLGINLIRTQVGDKYVAEEMWNNDYSLGGEQSGHIILRECSSTGDGICCALHILSMFFKQKSSIPFSEFSNLYTAFPQGIKNIAYNPILRNKIDIQLLDEQLDLFRKQLGSNGRILLRISGTEPVIRVMVEAHDADLMQDIMTKASTKVNNLIKQL